MMKILRPIMAILLFAILLSWQNSISYAEKVDTGHLEGSTYINNYFRFSLKIPDGWNVLDNKSADDAYAKGKDLVIDDKLRPALDASQSRIIRLINVTKYPYGTPWNPNLVTLAENMEMAPTIKNASDYLDNCRIILEKMEKVKIEVKRDDGPEFIDGVRFDTMDVKMTAGNIILRQKLYVTINRGYVLCFGPTYVSNDQLEELKAVLRTMKFQKIVTDL